MADFKRNDVVALLAGGPKMSVDKVSETTETVTATCVWLDQKGDKKRQDFPVDQLKLIERST
jgi:uncharacterized protein YodC (DUF2158 family)